MLVSLYRCRFDLRPLAGFAIALALLTTSPALAASIGPDEIVAIPAGVTGSGNGTLDLRMVTFSGSEVLNDGSNDGQCGVTFPGEPSRCNYDNANTDAAQGGGNGEGKSEFNQSYVTTAGDIQDYYELNFGATMAGDIELVLFLDLSETGGGATTNTFGVLDIILNPDSIQGSPNPSGDVSSAEQNAISQSFTLGAGSLIAELDPEPAANLPVNSQGAGFADYAIYTGIDPFSLDPSDVLLFNFSMDLLNNGGEEIFVSGTFNGDDVPEPSTGLLFAVALAALTVRARSRR
jgi:hypothetical protein